MLLENSNQKVEKFVQRTSIVFCILGGLGMAYGVYVLFLQVPVVSLGRLALAFLLFLVFAAASYFFTSRYLKDRLIAELIHKPYIIVFSFLLPFLFLPLFYIPPDYPVTPLLRQWTDVAVQYEIDANSRPVDLSKSDLRLQIDREVLDAKSFREVGIWKSAKDTFGLDPGMTASLQWQGTASQSMLLILQSPPANGTLTVYWDQFRNVFELSPESPKQIVITRKFATPWAVGTLLYVSAYILIVWSLLVLVIASDGKFSLWKFLTRPGNFRILLVSLAIALAIFTVKLQLDSLQGGADSYIQGTQLARHEAVLRGQALDPWQYRVLSEYVAEGFIRLFQFLKVQDAIGFGFISLRILQNAAIFLLAFAVYHKISNSKWIALTGLFLLAGSMKNAFYDNDLSFNTYFDLIFYLLAALLILNSRYYWIALVTVFAALNRETSGLIPFLLLAALATEHMSMRKKLLPFIFSGAIFIVIFLGLRVLYPNRPLYIPYEIVPGYQMLTYNIARPFTWRQLFYTLGFVPVIGLLFVFDWSELWRRFFLIMCPVWFVIHFFFGIAGETRLFLVPQAVIFIPGSLFALKSLLRFRMVNSQSAAAL